jgi:hypothetical protein
MKAPIDQGADAAIQLLDSVRDHVDCLPPLERAQWFCGFINATAAWSMGSVGWHHTETMLLAAIEIVPRAQDNGSAEQT